MFGNFLVFRRDFIVSTRALFVLFLYFLRSHVRARYSRNSADEGLNVMDLALLAKTLHLRLLATTSTSVTSVKRTNALQVCLLPYPGS